MSESSSELVRELISFLKAAGGAAVLIGLVVVAYRFVVRGLHAVERRAPLPAHLRVVARRMIAWSAILLGTLIVLDRFGLLNNAWALVSTVLALVGVGFVAMWSVLSNILCSIMLLIVGPFRVGDVVELAGQDLRGNDLRGEVVDFNLLFTTLRGNRNDLIQVPNNVFFQMPIRRQVQRAATDLNRHLEDVRTAASPPEVANVH